MLFGHLPFIIWLPACLIAIVRALKLICWCDRSKLFWGTVGAQLGCVLCKREDCRIY
ncbi:hypothetical protein Syun_029154 [Stephania yunnanensis]|uniref:Uncharacterized protein n=1 Tax=Stephania yunnanensis TaxID=152371 RepID=A0AAP0HL43_9MAGN